MDRLLTYAAIGWDFDGTLIDHHNSERIHAFIRQHVSKRHLILTFRSHGYQNRMFVEMRLRYPQAPHPECFADVINISDVAWENFDEADRQRRLHQLSGPLTQAETYYVEWKAMICHRLAIPVLIDDRRDQVLPGCKRYGIDYLHPDEL